MTYLEAIQAIRENKDRSFEAVYDEFTFHLSGNEDAFTVFMVEGLTYVGNMWFLLDLEWEEND